MSEPVVSFRETVLDASDHTVMSKSPNKHNRLYMQARAMEDGLAEAIDEGKVGPKDDPKVRTACTDTAVPGPACTLLLLLRRLELLQMYPWFQTRALAPTTVVCTTGHQAL